MYGIPYPVKVGGSLVFLAVIAQLGSLAVASAHVPFSGALLGTIVVAAWLLVRPRDAEHLPAADLLIRALPLLFVPLLVEALGPIRALGAGLGPAALTIAAATGAAALASAAVTMLVARWSSQRSH